MMKHKLQYTPLVFFSFLFLSFNSHPIKLTSSEIKYDSKKGSLRLQCNVFVDDFAPAISETLFSEINASNVSKSNEELIESYFETKYRIYINDEIIKLKLDSYKEESNVMSIVFYANSAKPKKNDKIRIENELLFEYFGPKQSNWIYLKLPPLVTNVTFESKIEDYIYTRKL